MDKEEAIKVTKVGAIAACVSATLTLAISLAAIFSKSTGELRLWNDPTVLIEVVLIYVLAIFIYRRSRTASILMLVYFTFSKVFHVIDSGQFSGLVLSILFIYWFFRATQGAFTYHRIEKNENPEYKATPVWLRITSALFSLMILASLVVVILSATNVVSSFEVQTADQLSETELETLISNGVITGREEVNLLYVWGGLSILDGGTLLTSDRLKIYFRDEFGDIAVYELFLDEITAISEYTAGGITSDSGYLVETGIEDRWMVVHLPWRTGGTQIFLDELIESTPAISID